MSVFDDYEVELLEKLIRREVDFVIVGGTAVVLHGHQRARRDLDILLASNPVNVDKLAKIELTWLRFGDPHIAALKQPGARVRHRQMGLDILTVIEGVATSTVMGGRVVMAVDGLEVPVISKQHLIEAKRAVGKPKDLADIAALS